jgi:rod shape-determining protein MreB
LFKVLGGVKETMAFLDNEVVGIDLGTANVRIYVKGKGIVLREPSVIAVNRNTGDMLAIGEEARAMLGRVPGNIVVVRPLKDGVISSYHDTERMLRFFLHKVIGRRLFFKPRVMVCVPSGVTEVEKRALVEVTEEAGARQASLIEEPVAAAIGAGLDIGAPYGNMVVDIGGGTTDVAVIALGGMVVNKSVNVAGDKLDEAIIKYMRKKHNILIGEKTAGEIKINIGSAFPRKEKIHMEVAGRNFVSGLPKTVILSSNDTIDAFSELLNAMLDIIHNVLGRTPPELLSDITEAGICITGGGALLYGLDRLISEKTGLPCYVAEDAISCVAIGTGNAADNTSAVLKDNSKDRRKWDF